VFAFDAGDLTENFDQEIAVGGFVHCEAQDTLAPIRMLKTIAAERGYRLIPGHDRRSGRLCSRADAGVTPLTPGRCPRSILRRATPPGRSRLGRRPRDLGRRHRCGWAAAQGTSADKRS